jgi:hypothetical protein
LKRQAVCGAALCLLVLGFAQAAPGPPAVRCDVTFGRDIPRLDWRERSDWINVRTETGARGDGVSDDSAAIQRALDRIGITPGEPKVVYLPPGRYLLRRTLSITERNGAMLVGHGRDTELVWDGAVDGRMLWSNGASRTTYLGLVFDGRGKAGVGIDHDSRTIYETRVRHESLEFRDFREAGIRVGHAQVIASAEMMFYNVVFRRNGSGAKFMAWNDYNNVFDGCLFEDNGFGIHAEKGNVVVRNSRFERSRESDVLLSTHSHSLRRVVSVGSRAFVRTVRGAAASGIVKIQSARVRGWSAGDGAIVTSLRGPVLVFDTVFEQPPHPDRSPIRLDNPPHMLQQAVFSRVSVQGSAPAIDAGPRGEVTEITGGGASIVPAATAQFVRSSVAVPRKIIDVKVDCGARGDGRTDDTRALQACVERIARRGEVDALLYFPSGRYVVSEALQLSRPSYQVGGTGWHSQIVRTDAAQGPVISIVDPQRLVIEHLAAGGPPGTSSIEQRATSPGSAFYRGVYGFDRDEADDQWIRFIGLPAGSLLQSDHLDGRVEIRDSTPATVLLGFQVAVSMEIHGNSAPTGLQGGLFRTSALASYPLEVTGNQSWVASDWYNEQTPYLLRARGGKPWAGRLTLDLSQAEARRQPFASLYDYRGRVVLLGGLWGLPGETSVPTLELTGTTRPEVGMLANALWNTGPQVNPGQPAAAFLANTITSERGDMLRRADDSADSRAAQRLLAAALDDLRELGDADLRYNACQGQ